MKKLSKKHIIIISSAVALVVVGILACILVPEIVDNVNQNKANKATEDANQALVLVLADQKDGALADGTVIRANEWTFICLDGKLSATDNVPDRSGALTIASIKSSGAAVFLLLDDSASVANDNPSEIAYESLIDPENSAIQTYTYSQINPAVNDFLSEVSYDDAEDSVSKIADYYYAYLRFDRPAGYSINLEEGELTVWDNGTKKAYTVTVEEGPYKFYNITPGVGGEFYVIKDNKVVQRGHLRPTGALRMIYSDTPGLQNIRDLGGWNCDGGTIKYNMLIRGSAVIDAADVDRNTWVKLLGIEHDVFLKAYAESQFVDRDIYRTQSPLGSHISLYQKDLSVEGSEDKQNFQQAKDEMNGIINRIFDNAITGETTYFHCLAGADRTGMVAVIIEGVLGVSRSDIDKDYELTSFSTLRERNSDIYLSDINIIRQYPGANFRDECVQYLLDCGITLDKINAFRKAVIDGDPELLVEKQLDEEPSGTNLCVPDSDGWIDGGRCSSTGEDRTDAQSYVVTNYFSVENGDVVYVKNLNVSDRLFSGMYTFDKTAISGFLMSEKDGTGFVKNIEFYDEWIVFTVDRADAGYLRLCGIPTSAKEDIIINIERNGEWLSVDEK
ncbi:MAG: tyrosine-protein phosphatase [Clostridia bacterium]|nr:tyrosine-protein phosphatase [Clostridia bacterium]